jgi:murein DD-endopeptidase MepM/ murein hydrolase activator NlpD
MKPIRKYTVMIIPHSEKEPLVVRIPFFIIQSLFIFLLFGLMLFIIGIFQYASLKKQVQELRHYEWEAKTMKLEFGQLSHQLIDVQETMSKISQIEARLRVETTLLTKQKGTSPDKKLVMISTKDSLDTEGSVVALSIDETKSQLEQLAMDGPSRLEGMKGLLDEIEERNEALDATPSIYPSVGRVTSTYGIRRDPFTRRATFHNGLDIANRKGTPVYATATGLVIQSQRNGGHGKQIILNHRNGIKTSYSHLSQLIVKEGETVEKGQLIAYMGNTGRSTGPHLHYEVWVKGSPTDPADYLPY